jgi:hypothetical protein
MPFFGNRRRDFSILPPRQQVDGTPFFVTDSANIDFTLNNLNLTADLTFTGVTAGTYGDATNIPVLQIDQWGRVTGVTTVPIGGGPGGTYTVNNGLTESPANNFQLGGATLGTGNLIRDTYITNDGYAFRIDQINTETGLRVEHSGTGTAIYSQSLDGEAVRALSTNGLAFEGSSTLNYTQALIRNNSDSFSSLGILKLERNTSGTSSANIGGSIDFWIEARRTGFPTPPAPTDPTVRLSGIWEIPGPLVSSRLSRFDIYGYSSGGSLLNASIGGDGKFYLYQYGQSPANFPGTPVWTLGVDASGNVVEFTGGGVPTTRQIATADSLTGGGDLSADRTLSLVNDVASPGPNKVYGTDGSGNRTWKADPSGGGGILHGTAAGTDTYTATITGATAYADGDAYLIRFTNGNTTSATLNISDGVSFFGAVPLYRNNDGPLIGGDILDGAEMLCVYNSTTNRFQVIGTSPNTLLSYVTNDDTVTLTKGMAVFAFGGTGDRMTVQRASNLSDSTSAQTVGLVLSSSIAPNQKGIIMMQGLLDGLNILPTATWNDGDPVFLGDTPGSITPTKPYAPKHLVYLGVVTTANNGSAGRMYVKVQNGYELDELHNVQAQSPNLNDTLYYDNTVIPAQWKTTSVNTLLNTSIKTGSFGVTVDGVTAVIQVGTVGYVVMPYAGTITGWSITANVSGSIQFDVWKATNAIPTVANTIIPVATNRPKLTSQQYVNSTTVTGWTTTFLANDVFGFYVDSASTIKNATLTIRTTKS